MFMTQAAAAMPPDVAVKVQTYKGVLRVSIALNVLMGLFALIWPVAFAGLLDIPEAYPAAWPRLWGAAMLAINALYVPGLVAPIRHRYPNIVGVAARLLFALLYLAQGGGFMWLALYDGLFGVALLVTYRGALRANLLSKP